MVIVVKVGGSLFDHPRLGPGLRAWLVRLGQPCELVVGGGEFADAVRTLDRVHHLGEEVAHRLAIDALGVSAAFVEHLLGRSGDCRGHPSPLYSIVDVRRFCDADSGLPHTWSVTTDSIALRYAIARQADRLILLKSVPIPPDRPWTLAAAEGWVDAHFPHQVADFAGTIETVDFRRWLDDFRDE